MEIEKIDGLTMVSYRTLMFLHQHPHIADLYEAYLKQREARLLRAIFGDEEK
jgi:hypothetical protein